MAAETITPTCEVTGLPLVIHPVGSREIETLSVLRPPDRHHAFHPEKSQLLDSVAGLALRKSRIQFISYNVHHHGYHNIFVGPDLPQTEDDCFRLSLLALSGVIPRKAISIRNKQEYDIVDLSRDEHQQIGSLVGPESTKEISRFYAQYAADKGMHWIIKEKKTEELLDWKTPQERKIVIARYLLREILGSTIENLELSSMHKDLKQEGLLLQKKPRTMAWTAKHVVRMHHVDYFKNLVRKRAKALQTGVATV